MLYVIELHNGLIGLAAARNLQSARKTALTENGSNNFKSVRKATDQDVSWVRTMGGRVPFDPFSKKQA
jgi:hypothetical protein